MARADRSASFPGEKMSYGYGPEADLSARAITAAGERTTFEVLCRGASLGEFTTHLAGRHNVLNVLAATAAALRKRIPVPLIRQAVACYTGTRRRFEIKAAFSHVRVIEDYAHHPTEIEAVIAACRDRFSGSRVLVLFQPHRFSRTQYLYREFAKTLMRADRLVLTDVYSAFENPIDGVSTRTIYEEAVKIDPDRVRLVQKAEIPGTLIRILGERDIVLILGAGDINELTPAIISAVQEWTGACR